jgi:hypothetical protein
VLKIRAFAFNVLAVVLALGAVALPTTANAYWRDGFAFGFSPIFVGPPVFFGPPVVYAPPPVVFAPPPVVYDPGPAPPSSVSCHAGAFICPLEQATPPGGSCSCPTNSGRAYGRAR